MTRDENDRKNRLAVPVRGPPRANLKQRISLATRLPLAGKKAVGDIAFQAGFVSPGHFSPVFRKVTGERQRRCFATSNSSPLPPSVLSGKLNEPSFENEGSLSISILIERYRCAHTASTNVCGLSSLRGPQSTCAS